MTHESRKTAPILIAGLLAAVLLLQGCFGNRTTESDSDSPPNSDNPPKSTSTRIEKKTIAGCWNEVLSPVADYFCVDLCFSLKYDDFQQLIVTPEKVHYRKEKNLLGLKWTETVYTRALHANGTYSLSGNKLHRRFSFPDPPDPDSAGNFTADTELGFRKDTLEVSGHLYLKADSLQNCGSESPWFTFVPDPPSGGGGDWDWD